METTIKKYVKRLCKAILSGRFNDLNYRQKKAWNGMQIQTCPLFCSYGTIGFSTDVYNLKGDFYCTVNYDWELKEFTINNISLKKLDL